MPRGTILTLAGTFVSIAACAVVTPFTDGPMGEWSMPFGLLVSAVVFVATVVGLDRVLA